MKNILSFKKEIFIFSCYIFTCLQIFSQDTIVRKDNQIIKAKIVQVGTSDVVYKLFEALDGPDIIISKADIKSLKIKGKDEKMLEIIQPQPQAEVKNPSPDILIKKNGDQLKVKVVEVGTNSITYKYFDALDGPAIVIEKKDVRTIKVRSKDDKTYEVINVESDPMSSSNSSILDKTSVLKFHFFSPLSKHLAFSYEWMIKPGFNWEVGLGVVGPGVTAFERFTHTNASGVFLRTGSKFLLGNSSDIEIQGERYAHPLKGRYFKIETILYTLSREYDYLFYNYSSTTYRIDNSYLGAVLDLVYGRQFIFGNSITVGWYIGVGYAIESKTSNFTTVVPSAGYNDYDPTRYSHTYFGKDFPLVLTSGFNVGYIFRTPEWVKNISNPRVSNKPPSRKSLKYD